MPIVNAGRDLIAMALVGDPYNAYTNAMARLGVGDSTNAFVVTQTDLQGGNKQRKGMEPTYPLRVGNALTFRSLFGTSDANFAWNEWGIFNAAAAGDMLNRKVENLGSKTSAQSWQLTVTVTVEAA